MLGKIKISEHALQRYCLRKYNDQFYYVLHPGIEQELRQRILSSKKKDIELFQDNEFVYAIRDNTLITVLNIPGNDMISDFFMSYRDA